MSKRKYTHMQGVEELVISMRESGMSWQKVNEAGFPKRRNGFQSRKNPIYTAITPKMFLTAENPSYDRRPGRINLPGRSFLKRQFTIYLPFYPR